MITSGNFEKEFRECIDNNDSYLKKIWLNNRNLDYKEIKMNIHVLLKKIKIISKKEMDLLIYIKESFNYSQKDLHLLFEDKKNFNRFCINYTKSSSLNREQKETIKSIVLRSFEYSFSFEEVKVFNKIFDNTVDSQNIIKEIIERGLEKEEIEKQRILKYQLEIPQAQKNVKIIVEGLNKAKEKSYSLHKEFSKLVNKNKISFIFQKEFDISYAILQYLNEYGCSIEPLDLDLTNYSIDNENYIVTYTLEENKEIISFLYEFLALEEIFILGIPINTIIANCELNGLPLVGQWSLDSPEVYNKFRYCVFTSIPASDYEAGPLVKYFNRKRYPKNTVKLVIADLKQVLNFEKDLDLAIYLYYTYLEPLNKFYEKRWNQIKSNIESTIISNENYKELKTKYLNNAIEKGYYKTKWKSEMKLYESVKKIYPSAIYQYRSKWLDRQSLDIFIPELRIGIEYQGKQHYESVDFFGGEKGFEDRIYLDEQKRKKCKLNKIELIEWKYDEIISKRNIIKKINEYKIILNK